MSEYPAEWPAIAIRVKNDAGWCCVRCGAAHSREGWRVLTVHHLDGDKANCRWWNLAALCQRCHLTIQGRVNMEQVYMLPHSSWFRPYVAGYYAFTLLGEEIDRAEAEVNVEQILRVAQPWLYDGPATPAEVLR